MAIKDLVQAYFKAFNKHDAQGVAALFGKSGTYADPAVPKGVKGDALQEYLRGHYTAFPDGRYRVLRKISSRDGLIAFEWRFTGTHAGALGNAQATNRPVDVLGSTMMKVRSGRIVWLHGYFDRRGMFRQLGL